jgi:nitrite reductase/ring-hydroxylating ferredoxin subunit
VQNIGVHMALVRACSTSEIPVGGLKFINAAGRDLVICNVDGKFYAMDNWCTHEQGNLSAGELNADILTCPEHGAQFDAATGRVILGPDGDRPDTISQEKSFKVVVQGSDLMVEVP